MKSFPKFSSILGAVALSVAAMLPLDRLEALGLQEVQLPPIEPVSQKITIDGNLDDWKSVAGFEYNPLSLLLKAGGIPAVEALLADPVSATLKTRYDSDALYVAVEWKDRNPGTNRTPAGQAADWCYGGEGFELHLLTDRVVHLACWPSADGKGLAIMARYGDETDWKDMSGQVTAAQALIADGKGAAQELRIPWSVITDNGKAPANGKLEFGADFAWNAIPADLLGNIRNAEMASGGVARGVTFSFLTARPALVKAGYISNPLDWGDLVFGGTSASGDQAVSAPDGSTSLPSFPVQLATTPPELNGSLLSLEASSFQTAGFLRAFWGNRFVTRLNARYDSENLYLASHFFSFGPMTNKKAESTQEGFGGGDALQVRVSDGKKKYSFCGWYDEVNGKPALTVDANNLPSPYLLQQGARESFAADADGKGYVQQVAVPWKLLFGQAPSDGASLKATFEPWFADLTPRFSLYGKLSLQRQGALLVNYKMPADGDVTLGLFDKGGKLLRWLTRAEFRTAGDNHEAWDGLDQWDAPIASGSYTLRALYHPPLSTDYKASVGNPGNPPWPSADDHGDWLADESNPQGAATDGKWVFLGGPCAEKGFNLIGVDGNGQRQWSYVISFNPRCVSLTVDSDYLYALFSGPETTNTSRVFLGKDTAIDRAILICLDKNTGKPAKFTKINPRQRIATWPYREEVSFLWDLRNNQSFSPLNYGGQPRYFAADVGESTNALGVAAAGGKLYVSMSYDNKLIEIDPATGSPTGVQIPIPAPSGLCPLDDHTLLAVSGRQVVKVDVASKAVTPFLGAPLVAPDSIAKDKDGNIYVSDWGASFQVKAFDASGRYLHAVGKEGGRPWVGKWDPDGMLVPRGIAVTDAGRLWVAEDDGSPKRVSVWDSKTGSFIKDYIGPTPYGGGTEFWADPKDPTQITAVGTRFKVDYDKKTYTPETIAFRKRSRDDVFTPNADGSGDPSWIFYHGGHEYAVVNVFGDMLSIMERYGDVYRPVAAVGSVRNKISGLLKNLDGTEMDDWDSDLGHHEYPGFFPDFFKGHSGDNYSWADTSGDNLVQPDEMKWMKTVNAPYQQGTQPKFGTAWGVAMSQDWTVFTVGNFRDAETIFRLNIKGWTPNGAPVYDIADARPIAFLPPASFIQGLFATKDNKLIVTFSYELGKNPDSMACYDFDGHKLWSIARVGTSEPSRQQANEPHANNAVFDFTIPNIGYVFGTWLWHGACRPFLITSDGLYVGTVLKDTLLGPEALWGESFTYYFQTPDGKPYVVNGGNDAEHILEIKGLDPDKSGRFETAYDITDADVQKAAAMREVPEQQAAPRPVIGVTWMKQAPVIDGSLSGWNMDTGVSLDGGNGKSANVALGRDAQNLYLAYKVHEPTSPLVNGGGDWQTLFTTGDGVDLMLGTDSKADAHRRAAVSGDERLFLTVFQGQPIAVLYRPAIPGTASPLRLASASIDQIIRLDSAKVAVSRDPAQKTYSIEASVPLKDLGIDPKQNGSLLGDVGVIFADDSGKGRSLRLYYYNHHSELVNDLTTEATLQPGEWGTIAMPLGPNLLQNGEFEEPLVESKDDVDKGWFVTQQANGSDATLSTESPYTGHHSLLMETTVPVVFPPEAFTDPDYRNFSKYANGGKGSANVEISQKVPVTQGHQYSLSFHYRALDFQSERHQPDPARGYVAFVSRIDWICEPPHHGSTIGAGRSDYVNPSQFEWKSLCDYNHGYDLPRPYTAPEGAIAANIDFGMRTLAANRSPQLFVDDVEFVDVTP